MIDPLVLLIIRTGFSVLFVAAALHKLDNRYQFREILANYKIFPPALVLPIASVIPFFELFLGIAWATNLLSQIVPQLTLMLLAAYTMSIAFNLLRGRRYIDCGCGFSSRIATGKNTGSVQQLSGGLVKRNLLLILLALIASLPAVERSLVLLDYFTLITASISAILIYAAYNQLLVNNNIILSWREPEPSSGIRLPSNTTSNAAGVVRANMEEPS